MAVPEDTGYPMKWFKNQDHVRDLYECVICLEVIKDPVQVRNCGHQFCRYCLDGILRLQPHCPSCREDISSEVIFSDKAALRAVGKLEVNCPYDGCAWDGKLTSFLQDHTKVCSFFNLSCTNEGCSVAVMRKNFENHLTECQHRIVDCEYCNKNHVFKDKFEHSKICEKFPMECKNKCSQKNIPRNEMELHLAEDCPKTVVECKYLEIDCKYKCERHEMEEHLDHGMKEHLELSVMEVSRLKDKHGKEIQELQREITAKCAKDIQELKREISGKYEKDIDEMKSNMAGTYRACIVTV